MLILYLTRSNNVVVFFHDVLSGSFLCCIQYLYGMHDGLIDMYTVHSS